MSIRDELIDELLAGQRPGPGVSDAPGRNYRDNTCRHLDVRMNRGGARAEIAILGLRKEPQVDD